MNAIPWSKLHGAAVHFPIALTFVAFACDAGALMQWARPASSGLRTAGGIAIAFAAAGCLGAAISGLVISKGEMWGAGDLGLHHRFVWPAFALIIAAATWRGIVGSRLTKPAYAGYVAAVFGAVILVSAAGYYGGEMLQGIR